MNRILFLVPYALAVVLMMTVRSSPRYSPTEGPDVKQAVSDAADAYIYGYPLVTMDMTRKQLTNVLK